MIAFAASGDFLSRWIKVLACSLCCDQRTRSTTSPSTGMWAPMASATIVEVETLYVQGRRGLLFRDGRQYEITWSTRKGELRLFGPDGPS